MKTHLFKTFAIIGICLLFSANSYGQTKEETEKWINDKFQLSNKIAEVFESEKKEHSKVITTNEFIEIKDGIVVYRLNENSRYYGYSSSEKRFFDDKYNNNYTYRFKIIDINYISIAYNKKFIEININKYSKTATKTDNDTGNSSTIAGRTVYIPFNDYEENIQERMKTALEHYQTFFPKEVKKKETF
uniref:hypothetical protein n=1 Tax=Flavobacterium sp. TaxID=239 RepID=UPI004049B8D4